MPFILQVKPKKPDIVNPEIMKKLANILSIEILNRHLYHKYTDGFSIKFNTAGFEIIFGGMSIADANSANFIVRRMSLLLAEIGFGNLLIISNARNIQNDGNKIFNCKSLEPQPTRNSQLIDEMNLDEKTIPSEWMCGIAHALMDDPVYIKGKENIKYNRAHLEYWLFQQDTLLDPFRRVLIHPSDIIEDFQTKTEIILFISNALEKNLTEQAEKKETNSLVQKYDLPDDSQASMAHGLRKSAAIGNDNDLCLFIKRVKNINIQDEKSHKRSALHWATIKSSTSCVDKLISAGADEELQDGSGRSALNYALEAKNNSIISIFSNAAEKRKETVVLFFKEILKDKTTNIILDYMSDSYKLSR